MNETREKQLEAVARAMREWIEYAAAMTLDQLTQKHYDALVKDRTNWRDVLATAAICDNYVESGLDDAAFYHDYDTVGRFVLARFRIVLHAHARELAEAEAVR